MCTKLTLSILVVKYCKIYQFVDLNYIFGRPICFYFLKFPTVPEIFRSEVYKGFLSSKSAFYRIEEKTSSIYHLTN